ncbi:MAG: hypothetical protein O7E55_00815 [Chloroflexi bacterium]|nr:hypothetical protein [Chloroflexota bacterium]
MKTDTKTKTVHPGKLGNLNAVKAGDSSVLLVGRVAKRIAREYLPELEDLFPWLSDTDRPALELLAGDIAKLRLSEGYLARKGEHDAEGKIRPQAHRATNSGSVSLPSWKSWGELPQAGLLSGWMWLGAGTMAT